MVSFALQVKIQIYPGDDHELAYNLYPLLSGYVALPPLHLTCASGQTTASDEQLGADVMADLLARNLPTHIYVLVNKFEEIIFNEIFNFYL